MKPCDKGAGIIICDYVDYAESCSHHLNSKTEHGEAHYARVTEDFIDETKKEIKKVLQEAFDENLIPEEDYSAMDPSNKTVG